MNLAQQTKGNWKPLFEPGQTMLNGGDIVRGLLKIVHQSGRSNAILEEQQFRERGLRSFNLRGDHSLLADVEVEKNVRVGQQCSQAVQPPQSLIGPVEERVKASQIKGRIRR